MLRLLQDEVEDGTAEGDAAPQDPSDGSWSWLPGARWAGAWRGLREDLFVAYQRLETRAIDLSPKGLAKVRHPPAHVCEATKEGTWTYLHLNRSACLPLLCASRVGVR